MRVMAIKWPKMVAPVTMTSTMQDILVLSTTAWTKFFQLSFLLTMPIKMDPPAPMSPNVWSPGGHCGKAVAASTP